MDVTCEVAKTEDEKMLLGFAQVICGGVDPAVALPVLDVALVDCVTVSGAVCGERRRNAPAR
jgi:hypothetical protein